MLKTRHLTAIKLLHSLMRPAVADVFKPDNTEILWDAHPVHWIWENVYMLYFNFLNQGMLK